MDSEKNPQYCLKQSFLISLMCFKVKVISCLVTEDVAVFGESNFELSGLSVKWNSTPAIPLTHNSTTWCWLSMASNLSEEGDIQKYLSYFTAPCLWLWGKKSGLLRILFEFITGKVSPLFCSFCICAHTSKFSKSQWEKMVEVGDRKSILKIGARNVAVEFLSYLIPFPCRMHLDCGQDTVCVSLTSH